MPPFGSTTRVGLAAIAAALAATCPARADDPVPRDAERFAELHALIARSRGEARWMEIDWYPSVQEARRKAAAEGKPLFLMAASGGAPVAGC